MVIQVLWETWGLPAIPGEDVWVQGRRVKIENEHKKHKKEEAEEKEGSGYASRLPWNILWAKGQFIFVYAISISCFASFALILGNFFVCLTLADTRLPCRHP